MKGKCSICGKNKEGISIQDYHICKVCRNNNNNLNDVLNEIVALIKTNEETNDSLEYNKQLSNKQALEVKLDIIMDGLCLNQVKMEKYKKDIIDKVSFLKAGLNQEIDSKTLKNINQCLNNFSIENLQEVSKTLNQSNSFDDVIKENQIKKMQDFVNLPDPRLLYEELSKNIINQDEALRKISIAIAKHFGRLVDKSIEKNNILILGPTGTGKTEICRLLSNEVKLPFVVVDSTTFTQNGYQGSNAVDTILQSLIYQAKGEIKKAEEGIVFIDEFDKKASTHSGNESSVSTVNVQHELLKLIEGGTFIVEIPDEKGIKRQINFNTENVLFIAAGAFSGIENLINKNKKVIGFGNSYSKEDVLELDLMKQVTVDHLKKYGIIPELIGRFSVITYTNKLTKDDLIRILQKEKRSLVSQYKKFFGQYKVNVTFEQDFLEQIAEIAETEGVGARGLKRIFESMIEDFSFNVFNYVGRSVSIGRNSKISLK